MRLSIAFLLASLTFCHSQASTFKLFSDSLFQLVPLQPRLHFIYNYLSYKSIHEVTATTGASTDSGTIEYILHDSVSSNDSTVFWNLEVRRFILHTVTIKFAWFDTSFLMDDTAYCVLTETTNGFHSLVAGPPVWQRPIVTPLDSTPVLRFSISSSDTFSRHWFTGDIDGDDSLIFVSNRGLIFRTTSTVSGLSHITRTFISTTIRLQGDPVLSAPLPFATRMSFRLGQNYPNPFNPSTIIEYSLPSPSYVVLRLYDLLGRELKILDEGPRNSGTHSIRFLAADFPSGVYFYQLSGGNMIQTKKLLLIK